MENYDLSLDLTTEVAKLSALRKSLSTNLALNQDQYTILTLLFKVASILMSCSTKPIGKNNLTLLKSAFDEIEISYKLISTSETDISLQISRTITNVDTSIDILENCIFEIEFNVGLDV